MRIAVIGVGGIGGYFAAWLARGGHEVTCVARGDNLAAIRAGGLRVEGPGQPEPFTAPCTGVAPGEAPPTELAILAVKSFDTAQAVAENRELLAGAGAILPLLNGVDHMEVLDAAAGPARVLGAVARGSVHRAVPGVITCDAPGWMLLGPRQPGQEAAVREVLQAMTGAGIRAEYDTDIVARMWWKLCWNAAFNSLTALLGARVGPVLAHPASRGVAAAIVREAMAVAAAEGVTLPADTVETVFAHAEQLGHIQTSMQVDAERGRRLEHAALTGSIVRHGRSRGVVTPAAATIDALLAFRDPNS